MLGKILNIKTKSKLQEYTDFILAKKKISENFGIEILQSIINPICKYHQRDLIQWGIRGGRRAIFASFGLGKTMMELEISRILSEHFNKPALIGVPLAAQMSFFDDAKLLGIEIFYVTDSTQVIKNKPGIYLSNYERIRNGNFNPDDFSVFCGDEASVLRGLDTETAQYVMTEFSKIPFRFVFTATPSPNEFTEILNYAEFLGIMDRGQALTRFFQRDSTKAGNLQLKPKQEEQFWQWVSSWAVFITHPKDLGYDEPGYDLPKLNVHYHEVTYKRNEIKDRDGNEKLFRDSAKSLPEASKEKRESLPVRIAEMMKILNEDTWNEHYLLWHHLEDERRAIQQALPEAKSVWGTQDIDEREENLTGFASGKYQYLSTKPEIAGSGCNFQYYCNKAIFLGIDYKFNDFIQAVHRIYRFMQNKDVDIHLIYTDAETSIIKALKKKWARHEKMIKKMTDIIKKYGLNNLNKNTDVSRTMILNRKETAGEHFRAINNDSTLELFNWKNNSVGMILSSIPFSDHYEYCESYYDAGHNEGDTEFFKQLGFLTDELLRILQPGRICAIHVKDRIRYSYQGEGKFTTISDFSGKTVQHFEEHGFFLMGKITVTTDVVRENNQTYRLGWAENCKDGTKMGVGMPEYILIFRKAPTEGKNCYADIPVIKSMEDYSLGRWQTDAHSFWKSSGNRLLSGEEIKNWNLGHVGKVWKEYQKNNVYDYEKHVAICDKLGDMNRLPTTFMAVPPFSNSELVWDNVNRMNTLNAKQVGSNLEKHICPLQFDIVDRLIERYSMPGETVLDPFGGLMTVPYRAIQKGRYGVGIELNEVYWIDGVKYCREAERKDIAISLFDKVGELEHA